MKKKVFAILSIILIFTACGADERGGNVDNVQIPAWNWILIRNNGGTIFAPQQVAATLCHFNNKGYIEAFITNISVYFSIHKPHQSAAYEKSKPVALYPIRIISTMKALE